MRHRRRHLRNDPLRRRLLPKLRRRHRSLRRRSILHGQLRLRLLLLLRLRVLRLLLRLRRLVLVRRRMLVMVRRRWLRMLLLTGLLLDVLLLQLPLALLLHDLLLLLPVCLRRRVLLLLDVRRPISRTLHHALRGPLVHDGWLHCLHRHLLLHVLHLLRGHLRLLVRLL